MKTPDEVIASHGAAAAETAQVLPAAAKAEKIAAEEPHRITPESAVPAVSRPEAPVQTSRPTDTPADDARQREAAEKIAKAEVAAAAQDVAREIAAGEAAAPEYRYPPITLLNQGSGTSAEAAGAELRNNSRRLAETLKSFGVEATAGDVVRGPSVTRYEFTLDQGVKLSKITNLQDDIALALGASGVRIAPIPDKISVVGVEVPNKLVSPVDIRSVLESREFTTHKSNVAFAVGKDIGGRNIIGNISKLPHVLIAGTTGSGKSVCTNSLIISMLYKSTPEEVRFIMVDPKMVELAPYNGIPHLLIPVVTDPKKAAGALQWAVYEMMKRYKLFSEHNVKELASFNALAKTDPSLKKLPTVVIVIDELADLMLVAAKEVEESICRVAQMGRAAGMHLVIATQRPSADVITGLMKANIPSRIAFAVASSLESRIILDSAGAEKLVGRGDMLYAPLGEGKPRRVQGCLITAEEIERVVDFVKENGETSYDKDVIEKIEQNVAEKEKGGKIAVYYAYGEIVDQVSSGFMTEHAIVGNTVVEDLNKLAKDDKVKAVVLRVNSPGGSAVASEQIWHALKQLKEKKPVVVSMGGLAASGGYMISAPASYIVAEPTTITGSIGIFALIPNANALVTDKLGVTWDGVTTNKNGDYETNLVFAKDNAKELQYLQSYVDRGYDTFLSIVADGRGMTKEQVHEIAQGRVWLATDALPIKLVDQLGSLDDAVKKAAELATIDGEYYTAAYPEKTDWLSQLMESGSDDKGSYLDSQLREVLGDLYEPYLEFRRDQQRNRLQVRLPFSVAVK